MSRMNCWEFEECGREPGGKNAKQLGVCPATSEQKVDGVNRGKNAGRSCWAIAGTLCGGRVQGTYAEKLGNCMQCDFYAFVRGQERAEFVNTRKILDVLSGKITRSCVVEKEDTELQKAL